LINGEVYISTERVKENAGRFGVSEINELHRVMAHGLLHLCGYGDKSDLETQVMRDKENEKIGMFHVKQ
jgi:rRNA maturation RNase YbeY